MGRPAGVGLGPDDAREGDRAPPVGNAPTWGERLLYVLGQPFLLWHRGELSVEPRDLDAADLARIIGVSRNIEFTSESRVGRRSHFPAEVLLADCPRCFPWSFQPRLLGISHLDAADKS